jgi:hypothetical protein
VLSSLSTTKVSTPSVTGLGKWVAKQLEHLYQPFPNFGAGFMVGFPQFQHLSVSEAIGYLLIF